LNYFKGHKFRSKVIVEFGVPYEITEELITTYSINKRGAITKLLTEIE
jgi:glycerol-3-phosphate O-acyltransferase/dihydroxyacetone phosphate acyltransferase